MSLVAELRSQHNDLWEQVVTHHFVRELGDGILPLEKFQRYFLQDYVFLRDFTALLALTVAKAPTFEAARPIARFLSEVLDGEESLFQTAFKSWGWRSEYRKPSASPTTRALADLMRRVAYDGTYAEMLTVLAVTELTYLEWATRLVEGGKRPKDPIYRAWIEIHSVREFKEFVMGLSKELDAQRLSAVQRDRVAELFHTTLRYELAFFEMGYRGEEWPA